MCCGIGQSTTVSAWGPATVRSSSGAIPSRQPARVSTIANGSESLRVTLSVMSQRLLMLPALSLRHDALYLDDPAPETPRAAPAETLRAPARTKHHAAWS